MDFTREPVVETVITPREGCKLVVRSSKGASSQEEYFVDAVEVVSFGQAFFFRSTEKPKSFLLPVVDYELLEVREARIVLKQPSEEKAAIKIGKKEPQKEEKKQQPRKEEAPKPERKRERKKHSRRGRSGSERGPKEGENAPLAPEERRVEDGESSSAIIRSLLSPPPLISETIGHYRETYSQAFFDSDEEEGEEDQTPLVSVDEPSETRENTPAKDLWNFTD